MAITPEWVSATAAIGALLLAAWAASSANGRLSILKGQERARQERERRADAAGVAVWVRVSRYRSEEADPVVRLVNAGQTPIYDLTVWIETPDYVFVVERTVTGPTQARVMEAATRQVHEDAARVGYRPDWMSLLQRRSLTCLSRFRDSSGQWWLRDTDGVLSETDAAALPIFRFPSATVVSSEPSPG